MSDKPLSPDLQETLNTLFDDEDEREEVAAFLRKHGLRKSERLLRLTLPEVTGMGLSVGLAAELLPLLKSSTPAEVADEGTEKPARKTSKDDSSIVGALGAIFGQDLSKMPLRTLLQRLADSGEGEPDTVTFADQTHALLSTKGVVLGRDGKIDVDTTLGYLNAKGGSLVGQRWKNLRVVRVSAAFGAKVEVSPIDLSTILQDGWDAKHMVEFSPLKEPDRNFVAWVADSTYRQFLAGDAAAAFVGTVAGGSVKKHERYKLAFEAYEDECKADPGVRTKYISRLYRNDAEPEVSPRGPFRDGGKPPWDYQR